MILLAPEAAREAWTSSLRIELAAEGGDVVYGAPPFGASARERALDALERAERAEVDAAVWVEPGHRELLHVLVLATESGRTLAAPLGIAPDGRTLALVAVSLLDEALAIPAAATPALAPVVTRPSVMLANPIAPPVLPSARVTDEELTPSLAPLGEPREPSSLLYAGLGTGPLVFATDVSFDPGTVARLVLGARVGEVLRVQANIEGGVFSERVGLDGGGVELQPFGRLCPEVAAAIPLGGGFAFWVGGHGCVGLAEVREPICGTAIDPFDEGLVMTVAAGGFFTLDIPVSDALAVWVRADLDGHTTVDAARQPDVLVSLTTTVALR